MKEQIDLAIKEDKIFFLGKKLQDDWYQAFAEWSDIARKDNNPEAYFNMAYCYLTSNGTKKNIEKAIEYYELSGSLGLNEAYTHAYKARAEYVFKDDINDYISYLESLKEKGVWSHDPDEKGGRTYFSCEHEALQFQDVMIQLSLRSSPGDRAEKAKELRGKYKAYYINLVLDYFIAISEVSAEVEYRESKISHLEHKGRIHKGNSLLSTRYSYKVEYLAKLKNNGKGDAHFDFTFRAANMAEMKAAHDKDPLNGLNKLYTKISNIMLKPGEQVEKILVTDLPVKNLSSNCVNFSYDFKRNFERYYVSSSYRGYITYDFDIKPGSISVVRKASETEKYKIKQFIAYAVVILGIYLYIKHLLG